MQMTSKQPYRKVGALPGRADQAASETDGPGVVGLRKSMVEKAMQPTECGRFLAGDAGLHLAYAGILVAIAGILMQACSLPGSMPPGDKPRSTGTMLLGVFFGFLGAGLTVTGLVALSI